MVIKFFRVKKFLILEIFSVKCFCQNKAIKILTSTWVISHVMRSVNPRIRVGIRSTKRLLDASDSIRTEHVAPWIYIKICYNAFTWRGSTAKIIWYFSCAFGRRVWFAWTSLKNWRKNRKKTIWFHPKNTWYSCSLLTCPLWGLNVPWPDSIGGSGIP